MALYIWPLQPISVVGGATEATALDQLAELEDINTNTAGLTDVATQTTLAALNAKVTAVNTGAVVVASSALPSGAATETTLATIDTNISSIATSSQDAADQIGIILAANIYDQIDSAVGPLLYASINNIPASASLPLELVASLATPTYWITSVEDIGEFLGLYTGAASSEVLAGVLPLGGGDLKIYLPQGVRVSIRNMKNAAITSGNLAINFIG